MKRIFISHRANVLEGHCTCDSTKMSLANSEYRTPTILDKFYEQELRDNDNGCKCIANSNPIYMLLNQQRINSLGQGNGQQLLREMQVGGLSAIAELKSKMTDEELLQLVPCRYYQHPTELQHYLDECVSDENKFKTRLEEARKRLEDEKLEEEKKKQKSD